MTDTAPEAAKPTEAMHLAMKAFMQARMGQLKRDGLDPAATAVNLSMFGLQFENLVSMLIDRGVFTRDEFQTALSNTASRMATAMQEQLKLVVTPDQMH